MSPAQPHDRKVLARIPAGVWTLGFVSLLITYYAVNLWIVGLHSYAGV